MAFPEEVAVVGYPDLNWGEYVYYLLAASREGRSPAKRLFFGIIQCPEEFSPELVARRSDLTIQILATTLTQSGGFRAYYKKAADAVMKAFASRTCEVTEKTPDGTRPIVFRRHEKVDMQESFALGHRQIGVCTDSYLSIYKKLGKRLGSWNKLGIILERDEFLKGKDVNAKDWEALEKFTDALISAARLKKEGKSTPFGGNLGGAIVLWDKVQPFGWEKLGDQASTFRLQPTRVFLRAALQKSLIDKSAIISPDLS